MSDRDPLEGLLSQFEQMHQDHEVHHARVELEHQEMVRSIRAWLFTDMTLEQLKMLQYMFNLRDETTERLHMSVGWWQGLVNAVLAFRHDVNNECDDNECMFDHTGVTS